jgi:hypothetical protein
MNDEQLRWVRVLDLDDISTDEPALLVHRSSVVEGADCVPP